MFQILLVIQRGWYQEIFGKTQTNWEQQAELHHYFKIVTNITVPSKLNRLLSGEKDGRKRTYIPWSFPLLNRPPIPRLRQPQPQPVLPVFQRNSRFDLQAFLSLSEAP
jgi:hypothetical protein